MNKWYFGNQEEDQEEDHVKDLEKNLEKDHGKDLEKDHGKYNVRDLERDRVQNEGSQKVNGDPANENPEAVNEHNLLYLLLHLLFSHLQ